MTPQSLEFDCRGMPTKGSTSAQQLRNVHSRGRVRSSIFEDGLTLETEARNKMQLQRRERGAPRLDANQTNKTRILGHLDSRKSKVTNGSPVQQVFCILPTDCHALMHITITCKHQKQLNFVAPSANGITTSFMIDQSISQHSEISFVAAAAWVRGLGSFPLRRNGISMVPCMTRRVMTGSGNAQMFGAAYHDARHYHFDVRTAIQSESLRFH